jgi:hypothetical protein
LLAGIEYRFSSIFLPDAKRDLDDRGVNSGGVRPDDDLHLRLTLFLDLE